MPGSSIAKRLSHRALGCRASRLPWEKESEEYQPQLGLCRLASAPQPYAVLITLLDTGANCWIEEPQPPSGFLVSTPTIRWTWSGLAKVNQALIRPGAVSSEKDEG